MKKSIKKILHTCERIEKNTIQRDVLSEWMDRIQKYVMERMVEKEMWEREVEKSEELMNTMREHLERIRDMIKEMKKTQDKIWESISNQN